MLVNHSVGVLFVLSSSVCLIFPSLSSVFYLLCLQQTLGSSFSLFQIIDHNSRDPVWVVCLSFVGLCLCICLIPQSKERKKETGVVKRKKWTKRVWSDWQWRQLMFFTLSVFPSIKTQPLLYKKKKRKYTGILTISDVLADVCVFVCFRTESVAEKMLTNWFAFLLHKFLKVTASLASCNSTSLI